MGATMRKTGLVLGLAAGYVLGARAGRERYDQIMEAYSNFMGNPKVQDTMSSVQDQASHLAETAKEKVSGAKSGSDSDMSGSDSAYDVVEMPDTMAQAGSNGRMGV
jgi:hypothetical protein